MRNFIDIEEIKETTSQVIEHIRKFHKIKETEELLQHLLINHGLTAFLSPFHREEVVENQFGKYPTTKVLHIVLNGDSSKTDFVDEVLAFHDLHKDDYVKHKAIALKFDVTSTYPDGAEKIIEYMIYENSNLDRDMNPDLAYMVALDLSMIKYIKSYGESEGE